MTLSDIAGWLRLSWDTVKAVVKGRLEKDYRRIGYRRVRQIAIDELYLGRTRKYITLVMDMESARIIWVGEGRGAEALREFWRRFKLSGARLKAVAMDMSGAYACSVRAHAPHAILTFDRFHVMKLMNERLDDLRRELARETQDRTAKEAIKGLRWLLLHRRDNLEKDAAKRLERSLEINQPLQCAYLLKEELGELWQQDDGRKAWAFLREWAAKATASGIRQLQAMAKPLLRHAKGILSFYHTGLTTGKMEGINRKIRGLLASAFGFRGFAARLVVLRVPDLGRRGRGAVCGLLAATFFGFVGRNYGRNSRRPDARRSASMMMSNSIRWSLAGNDVDWITKTSLPRTFSWISTKISMSAKRRTTALVSGVSR